MALNTLPPPGTGYFVAPPDGPGPGVLVIPSPWGLTTSMKRRADELADAGFSVLVPDLNDGQVAANATEADEALMSMDMNVAASLVQSSLRLLRAASHDPDAPAGLIGFAAGASWALWLSERLPDQVSAVVAYYGTQSIEFSDATAAYLLHFGEEDAVVSNDDVAMLGLSLQLAGRDFTHHTHAGAGHGFAEAEHLNYHPGTDAIAWRQTTEFLAGYLR